MGNARAEKTRFFTEELDAGRYVYCPKSGLIMRLWDAKRGWLEKPRLGTCIQASGYLTIQRRVNGRFMQAYAHCVVYEHIYGEIPKGLEVNHVNGVKSDNRLCNLEAVSKSENQLHAYRLGLSKKKHGEANPATRFTDEHIAQVRALGATGLGQHRIGKIVGMSQTHVGRVLRDPAYRIGGEK